MKGKARALFFISSLAGGGAERVMVNILSHISRDKIDLSLIVLRPYDDSPYKKYLPGDIKVTVILRKFDSFFEKIRQCLNFLKAVRREKPRVILSMLSHNNIMALFAGVLLRIRVVVCEHNTLSEVVKTEEGRKILRLPTAPLVKIFYPFADQIVAVSEGVRADLIEKFHIRADKIQVIYNPMDIDSIIGFSKALPEHPFFREGVLIFIAVGRLVQGKGFDILIEAFHMVLSEMDARLIILGEGPQEESLKKLVDTGLTGKVSFAGFQKNPYAFLSRADIFVLSSRHEGLPMVLLEAMACGIPVIATDCRSGPREILDNGRCGLLVPTDDVSALSREMIRLAKDRALREDLSRLGRERARDFAIDRIIKQYEKVLHDQLNE